MKPQLLATATILAALTGTAFAQTGNTALQGENAGRAGVNTNTRVDAAKRTDGGTSTEYRTQDTHNATAKKGDNIPVTGEEAAAQKRVHHNKTDKQQARADRREAAKQNRNDTLKGDNITPQPEPRTNR